MLSKSTGLFVQLMGRWKAIGEATAPSPLVPVRGNAHLPASSQKRHYPLQDDEEPVREPNEKIDVHNCPDNLRRKSREPQKAKIGDRIRAPHDREVSLVPIPEGRGAEETLVAVGAKSGRRSTTTSLADW